MIGSIIFVAIGLSLLILVHELGHFLAARYFGLFVEEFGIGFPPRLLTKKIGQTIYSLNLIPLGGFVRIHGEYPSIEAVGASPVSAQPERSFVNQSAGRRAIIIVAGVLMNFVLGWLIISGVLFVGSPSLTVVELVQKDSPAAESGLQKGDVILGFATTQKLVDFIDQNKGQAIALKIKRGKTEFEIRTIPRVNPLPGQGVLGVGLADSGIPQHSFLQSLVKGLLASLGVAAAVLAGLYQVVFTPESLIGPVGIFDIAITTSQLGLIHFFQFLALISLNLVVLNILPIPALDGGRLLFIILEKLRGRKFTPSFEMRANAVGLSFLIMLIVLVTIKDMVSLL